MFDKGEIVGGNDPLHPQLMKLLKAAKASSPKSKFVIPVRASAL